MKNYSWEEIECKLESLKYQLGIDIWANNVRPEVMEITGEAFDICAVLPSKIKAARGYAKIGREDDSKILFEKIELKIRRLEEIMKVIEA